MEKEKITLEIYGGKYSVNKEGKEELHILSVARYVDEKMREIANTSHIVDTGKVAVLAALNIADELFTLRENKEISDERIEEETKKLTELLEKSLKG